MPVLMVPVWMTFPVVSGNSFVHSIDLGVQSLLVDIFRGPASYTPHVPNRYYQEFNGRPRISPWYKARAIERRSRLSHKLVATTTNSLLHTLKEKRQWNKEKSQESPRSQ